MNDFELVIHPNYVKVIRALTLKSIHLDLYEHMERQLYKNHISTMLRN